MNSASSSSNSDENVTNQSSSEFSSGTENFFSISEDTPQNSPMKTIPLNNSSTPSSSKAVSVDLYSPSSQNSVSSSNINNGTSFSTTTPRTRRLSNSSVASDVSFRLPQYESQHVSVCSSAVPQVLIDKLVFF